MFSQGFAIIGTILVIATYFRYGYQIKNGSSNPSLITLLLWLVEGIINAFTYWESVRNIWQTLATIATPILSLYVLLLCFWLRKFSKIKWIETVSLVLALIIGFFWLKSGNNETSNGLLQIIYGISFLPIGYNIVKGAKENPIAWNLAIASYSFSIMSVLVNYTGSIISFLFYGVNGLGNVIIVILIYSFRKKKKY